MLTYILLPGQREDFYVIVLLLQPPLQQHLRLDMRNQTIQNVVVGRASRLLCNHPRPRNHQAYHDWLVVPEQILQDIPGTIIPG